MIKVKGNRIFDGLKTYEPGEMISGLSFTDEADLVAAEVAEYVGNHPAETIENHEEPDENVNDKEDEDGSENQPVYDNEDPGLNLDLDDVIVDAPQKPSTKKGK